MLATAPLGALRAFEAAARHGSFKAAAAELGVTPAAVSHQIATLERHLGVLLFVRLNRAIEPTPKGAALAGILSELFDRLADALDAARRPRGAKRSVLTVTAVPSLAAKWLAPRLHRFRKHHPGIDLRLSATDHLIDLARDRGVDVALRYGAGPYHGVKAEPLWSSGSLYAVCSPRLLAGKAPLRRPADLAHHVLMSVAMPPGAIDKLWPDWLKAAGIDTAEMLRVAATAPAFGATHLALEAAAGSGGVVLAPHALVASEIAAGRLARPFEIAIPDPFRFWLLYRADQASEAGIAAWRRWILKEAKEFNASTPANGI
jgi:LysR family transcriptional regulator, glycine cleavage system transcriptional activator